MPIPDFCKGGDFNKFIVIKATDLKYLTCGECTELEWLLDTIKGSREKSGKTPENTYLVINTDEPYAPEIVEILKRNGHWG